MPSLLEMAFSDDPDPPVAPAVSTNVAPQQQPPMRIGNATLHERAGGFTPSEIAALQKANQRGIPLPNTIETVSRDSIGRGVLGRATDRDGGIIQLSPARNVDADTVSGRLPYIWGEGNIPEEPVSRLRHGRPESVQTLTHELSHFLQDRIPSALKPKMFRSNDPSEAVYIPPFEGIEETGADKRETEADLLSVALQNQLFGPRRRGLPDSIGVVSVTPGKASLTHQKESTANLVRQYQITLEALAGQ